MEKSRKALQAKTKKGNRRQSIRIFFGRGFIVKICFAILVLFLLTAIFANFLAPYEPNAQDLLKVLQGPSKEHLLGSDYLGRDVLSRIMYGGRVSLTASFLSGTLAAVIGITLGLIAGYFGGVSSRIIMGITDVILSIPGLVFTLIIAAVMGGGLISLIVAIGLGMIPTYIRMMNGLVLSLRENDSSICCPTASRPLSSCTP
jgi:peptide/nickel transport system permease protein